LRSQPGQGAEFRLSLPLTLAIIEGFMVGVGHDRYVLPLGSARETIDLPTGHETGSGRRNIVCLRDQFIPYLRIRDLFGHGPAPAGVRERIVIVDADDTRIGLVVDEVLGNHQTVIKSLGWLAPKVNIFSGATVLGDGTIALILDIPGLVARTQKI
jgi:two-component system chemotaxis sensor kinase CheA